MGKIVHEELSKSIIGIAMEVLNELMIIELRRCGRNVVVQPSYPVRYRGEVIGNLVPDLIVDDAIIIDPKVVSAFNETDIAQMLGYLNITGLQLALLLNFKDASLSWKRIVGPNAKDATPPDLHA